MLKCFICPRKYPPSEIPQLRVPLTPQMCYVRNVDLGRSAIAMRVVLADDGARLGRMVAPLREIGFSIRRRGRVMSESLSSSYCEGLNSASSFSDGSGSGGSDEFSVPCVLVGVAG